MKKILGLLIVLLFLTAGCIEKNKENLMEKNSVDEVLGMWESKEYDSVVKIISQVNEENYAVYWKDEEILTKFMGFDGETNEFLFQSVDIKKWNIKFFVQVIDKDHMIIYSSNVEGEMLGITRPIDYERIK